MQSYWTKPADFPSGSLSSSTGSSTSTYSKSLLWVVKKDPKSGKNFYYNRKTVSEIEKGYLESSTTHHLITNPFIVDGQYVDSPW
jgi:hypothetical protein